MEPNYLLPSSQVTSAPQVR